MSDLRYIKCVIVGDGAVGKTCLLITYTTNRFPSGYVPTVFDSFSNYMHIDSDADIDVLCRFRVVKLGLFDTAAQKEYDRLRALSYPQTDIFLVCFDLSCPTSFHNVKRRWIHEVRHFGPGVPVLLIGTKSDERDNEEITASLKKDGSAPLTYVQGLNLSKEIGAARYLECSALTRTGVKEVFETAVRTVLYLSVEKRTRKFCTL